MSRKNIFERYTKIAEVLGKMFPNILEVVVHDFTNLDKSVIFIVNGNISGRTVGAGASELGVRRLLGEEEIPDTLINYTNINKRGNRLKSASIAIRDDKRKMIGAFCLNFDVSGFEHIQKFLHLLTESESLPVVGEGELRVVDTVEKEIQNAIQEYLIQHNLAFAQITYANKQSIVSHLKREGFLRQRGAVFTIANTLKMTRQSIYNYLKKEN